MSPNEVPDDQPLALPFDATSATTPRRAAGVREFPLGTEDLLLFAEGRQVVHTLNLSAWAVWDLCDGSRSVESIAAELAAEVGRPVAEIERDVLSTVQQLGSLGLLLAS